MSSQNIKPSATIYQGDVLDCLRTLSDESVHCCITSPPYWGLRDYGVPGQIGNEQTFELFIEKQLQIFSEVRRVLHKTGTLWLNMGDSYNAAHSRGVFGNQSEQWKRVQGEHGLKRETIKGLHSKNLVGQPWRLAFALQQAGWILRSDIIWHKPTAMPESVTDRPTKAHEYVFLFAKSPKYFFDSFAIREPVTGNTHHPGYQVNPKAFKGDPSTTRQNASFATAIHNRLPVDDRNKRTVWSIPSEPFPEAHFATFPTKLVEPCIKAGSSEKGCCPICLAPWERTFEKQRVKIDGGNRKRADAPGAVLSPTSTLRTGEMDIRIHSGWKQSCKCAAQEPVRCSILDPYSGSGTTAMVALRQRRDAIGIELNPEYVEMSTRRVYGDAPLFNEVHVVKFSDLQEVPF